MVIPPFQLTEDPHCDTGENASLRPTRPSSPRPPTTPRYDGPGFALQRRQALGRGTGTPSDTTTSRSETHGLGRLRGRLKTPSSDTGEGRHLSAHNNILAADAKRDTSFVKTPSLRTRTSTERLSLRRREDFEDNLSVGPLLLVRGEVRHVDSPRPGSRATLVCTVWTG